MAVKVIDKKTGKETTGKFAAVKGEEVQLWTGIMSDKKGGWRGCGNQHRLGMDINDSSGRPYIRYCLYANRAGFSGALN